MKYRLALLIVLALFLAGCQAQQRQPETEANSVAHVNPEATNIEGRFLPPEGYERASVQECTFATYLRSLPLKSHGSGVKLFNGASKNRDVYEAVVDLEIGNRDLQQCADAVIRLRAEYLFQERKYDQIHFDFTNGFRADYSKWRAGYRVVVQGNSASWVKNTGYSGEYRDFRKYLDTVFAYAGTLSLAKELTAVKLIDMQIGDVFIQGGSPGHCVIVVDMAQHKDTGEKVFMLAQSYMPAQDIQILKNPGSSRLSPWYSLDFGEVLRTPEWTFKKEDLKRFS